MLYGIIGLLIIVAVVLFLADVAVGGGILGVLALLALLYLVLGTPKRV